MPHLLIRGVSPHQIRVISKALVAELAGLCQCPADHILLECLNTSAVFDGEIVPSYPFVEVNWFDRGQSVRDLAAECIDRHVRSLGFAEAEVAFRIYDADSYYANGVKLSSGRADEDVARALQEENHRLKEELQKTRKALQSSQASSTSHMSSRLYDALRE
ncbi:DUF1904 family protein [Cohnella silvisoli]|uniref:DUF1904 family protein n=1 Tax=Cohnella silvisoli TaxID=2873699 RepID=A0ABV1L0D5_9BACL|nr:DUF1904 family protein [Cohnella silvisoli]MCD9024887.1 DUF1904 domain-containing protein [Cohnella silvisoli]